MWVSQVFFMIALTKQVRMMYVDFNLPIMFNNIWNNVVSSNAMMLMWVIQKISCIKSDAFDNSG